MKPVSFVLGLGFVLILLSSCSQVTNQSDSNLDPKLYGEWICDTLTDSRGEGIERRSSSYHAKRGYCYG